MPLSIDRIADNVYALAHRYELNGDLVPDPDVEFYVCKIGVYPMAIDQILGYRRVAQLTGDGGMSAKPREQADLAAFCNLWLANIKQQQRL